MSNLRATSYLRVWRPLFGLPLATAINLVLNPQLKTFSPPLSTLSPQLLQKRLQTLSPPSALSRKALRTTNKEPEKGPGRLTRTVICKGLMAGSMLVFRSVTLHTKPLRSGFDDSMCRGASKLGLRPHGPRPLRPGLRNSSRYRAEPRGGGPNQHSDKTSGLTYLVPTFNLPQASLKPY